MLEAVEQLGVVGGSCESSCGVPVYFRLLFRILCEPAARELQVFRAKAIRSLERADWNGTSAAQLR